MRILKSDMMYMTWWNTFAVLFRVRAVQVIDGVDGMELNLCQVTLADTNKHWRRRRSGLHDHFHHWQTDRECKPESNIKKKINIYLSSSCFKSLWPSVFHEIQNNKFSTDLNIPCNCNEWWPELLSFKKDQMQHECPYSFCTILQSF